MRPLPPRASVKLPIKANPAICVPWPWLSSVPHAGFDRMQILGCNGRFKEAMTPVDPGVEQTYARHLVTVRRESCSRQHILKPFALLFRAQGIEEVSRFFGRAAIRRCC